MSEPQAIYVPEQQARRQDISVPRMDALSATPMQLLAAAIQQGADIDKLAKLMDLRDRWEASEARKKFTEAMAAFKQNPPEILKDKHVAYKNKNGGMTEYDHATLGGVCAAIIKGLSDHGISHRWVTEQGQNRVKVTCILAHAAGHSESAALESAPDDSGGKNSIQAIASAVSYLQRYTLLAVTGVATNDMDDDGRNAGNGTAYISDTQIAQLIALGTELGVDKEKFLHTLKVNSLEEIPAASFPMVLGLLEARRARGAK